MAINDGKQLVYCITGASRGIGLEYVKQLLERGHLVVAAARNPAKSEGLTTLAKRHTSALTFVTLDVADPASIKAAAASVSEAFPDGIDVLINNAGVNGNIVRSSEQDENEFKEVLLTNTLGPFMVTKAFLPLLKKGNKKQIVNITSTLGSIGIAAKPLNGGAAPDDLAAISKMQVAYKASKAALNMTTVALAVDLQEEGITVIAMCPGWVDTDMGSSATDGLGIEKPPLDPPTSVGMQLKVIDGLTLEKSGTYFNHEGNGLPF
ncbi:Uncharacterized oxidoreductase C663.09c [Coccomyxa sp. Obi]|nr:Uncharacterized oxidoreductase C663.09c [Coccomyxa sp. Obi]